MSSEQYSHIEQDHDAPNGTDELPTYDDLAAQNGPNSRFGRWRGWIEKRAAERYLDVSPEERARRRERGWGNDLMNDRGAGYSQGAPQVNISVVAPPSLSSLSIQTNNIHASPDSLDVHTPSPPLPPLPFISQRLAPTHLKINQFGSRFLPHTTSPIRCLLPIASDKMLLIGHDEGLSVLDMFPQEWTEDGRIVVKGPDEAHAYMMWQGESIIQMSLLEVESNGEGTPQGVVLALVGPDPDTPGLRDADSMRSLRMYNLASLTSLAKWAVAQKGARPLDLRRPSNWQVQQSPSKRRRPQSTIARGLKALIDSPGGSHPHHSPEHSISSYDTILSPSSSLAPSITPRQAFPRRLSPNRKESNESSWDLVDDLPLRWATDFVPLASNGSRLLHTSILSYALWSDENRKGRGGRLLAIATKNNILLYETPKGERAFRFVKEFYTPLQPKSVAFFQQSVHEVNRSLSDVGTPGRFQNHRRTDSSSTLRGVSDTLRASSSATATLNYGTHLSLFVVFDKKAGWIRMADSAVGEMELYDVGGQQRQADTPTSSILRSRMSFEHHSPKWIPPVRCTLPALSKIGVSRDVHLLTRGKHTHIVPCPLPVGPSSYPPLAIVSWRVAPTSISARVCEPPPTDGTYAPPFLQVIAFGEHGLEVQELLLSFMGKGKGRAVDPVVVRAEDDLGGDAGFLCVGGHWDQSHYLLHQHLDRSHSTSSSLSGTSCTSMESEDLIEKMAKEEGVYGWCRKGAQDWRVFWVGGSSSEDSVQDSEDSYFDR
ncbi:hypothetical protein Hypma_012918 [Hypsizygus marmoreus]|uniref:Uncharacterized protein n=1 Tax=Hypsizygus marmoreus TaxID=39966 RepID=A0A369JKG3_HYPMA|nr:hypothetical protein Hypma_012918 [Hypsizygus marmoreus]